MDKNFLRFLSMLACVSQASLAQFPSTVPRPGARAASLGDAYVAEAPDGSCMYWNPAAIAFLNKPFVFANFLISPEAKNEVAGVSFRPTSSDGIALAGRVSLLNQLRQYGLDIAYARALTQGVSLGVRLGAAYGSSATSTQWASSASIGVYHSPGPEISYGITYDGIGFGMRYSTEQGSFDLEPERLPQSFHVGVAMHYPSTPGEQYFTFSVENSKVLGLTGLSYKGGIEVYPVDFFSLRWGYQAGPEIIGPRYGTGLRVDRFTFDYAFSNQTDVPTKHRSSFHQLSLSIALDSEGAHTWP